MDFKDSPAYLEVIEMLQPIIDEMLSNRFKAEVHNQLKNSAFRLNRVNPRIPYIHQLADRYTNPNQPDNHRIAQADALFSSVLSDYAALVKGELGREYRPERDGIVFEYELEKQQSDQVIIAASSETQTSTEPSINQNDGTSDKNG